MLLSEDLVSIIVLLLAPRDAIIVIIVMIDAIV